MKSPIGVIRMVPIVMPANMPLQDFRSVIGRTISSHMIMMSANGNWKQSPVSKDIITTSE